MRLKLKSLSQIKSLSIHLKKRRKKIVFTNGCFDILHAGHVMYLDKAKSFGDVLILGLNSDASVKRLKGPSRPVNLEKSRAFVLSALEMIDYIVIFNSDTPLTLIKSIKPDVLVKGSDWQIKEIAGAKEVLSWGGAVKRVSFLKGHSTTGTIQKIQRR